MPRFRPEQGTFRSWVFTIAHNAVVDEHRRRRSAAPIDAAFGVPAPDAGPEAEAVLADQVTRLRALLADLPPDQANVVQLRLAGLDDREIASVLGRSYGAVRVAQHRALTRLRAAFAASETENADAR